MLRPRCVSVRTRIGLPFFVIGAAHFLNRRFDKAVTKLLLAIQEFPCYAPSYRCLAACYAHMERPHDAQEIIVRLRAITPVIVPSIMPYRNPEHREFFLSGLRLAAGATT
jgi:hypothetical protein